MSKFYNLSEPTGSDSLRLSGKISSIMQMSPTHFGCVKSYRNLLLWHLLKADLKVVVYLAVKLHTSSQES